MLQTKARILVVDDYPALVTITRHKLLQKGYEVLTAQNGQDAFDLVQTEYPDLVISDVEMPVMNGYELCRHIKNHPDSSRIPIILVTSMVTTESLMKGIEAGADNYLTKPYDDETLFQKVEDLLLNPPLSSLEAEDVPVTIDGKNYKIRLDYAHLVNLLVSTYKNTLAQNTRLDSAQARLSEANQELELTKKEHEELLQNVFPKSVAESLLAYGTVTPERFSDVTVLFTDFEGFTKVVPTLTPEQLIESLTFYFDRFDSITDEHNLIKIKTIGDSYMAAGGLPERNHTHPVDVVLTALKMKFFVERLEHHLGERIPYFPLRIGIHTGQAVVGVIGKKRFAYDMWGEGVNLAARMEQYSEDNSVNISEDTYQRVKDFFECEPRGEIDAKNVGKVPMYFVRRIKQGLSDDEDGLFPNRLFVRNYNLLARGSG
ncbi:MAG: adenylate/guanylate cyclase domain-containing protein [Bacteroidota bacterium]